MSSLADRFESAARTVMGFDAWFASQTEDDQAVYLRYAADPRVSHRVFHDIVRESGARAGRETVTAWRKDHGFPRG